MAISVSNNTSFLLCSKALLQLRVKRKKKILNYVRFFFQKRYKEFLSRNFKCALSCIKLSLNKVGMLHFKYLRLCSYKHLCRLLRNKEEFYQGLKASAVIYKSFQLKILNFEFFKVIFQ